MRRRIKYALIGISLVFCLLFAACACDAFLQARGTIYEWQDAPDGEEGEIYVDEEPPAGYDLRPIENAIILICDSEEDDNIPLYGHGITSDSEGRFEVEWAVAPSRGDMKIVVEKDGYFTVERLFEGARIEWYQFVVILVARQ